MRIRNERMSKFARLGGSGVGIAGKSKKPTAPPTVVPDWSAAPVEFQLYSGADDDLDGYTNDAELGAGTDPNDANSFPVSLFNVFNGV